MSAAAIFTRRVMGMDYRVWLVMPAVWVLSLALLGYKYLNETPCAPATINMDGKPSEGIAVRYVNQLIKFEIQTDSVTSVEWSFNDVKEQGLVVYHKFTKEGKYNVVARVNGTCRYEQKVRVRSRDELDNHEKGEFRIFPYPEKPKYSVGDIIRFESEKINVLATSYEWKVLQTNETRTDADATFTFRHPGKYTIQLILNNDPSLVETRRIEVSGEGTPTLGTPENPFPPNGGAAVGLNGPLVQPEENSGGTKGVADSTKETKGPTTATPPAAPPVKKVDPEAFKELLQSVVNEEKELEDLYEFLDYKASTMVEVNGNKSLIPLKDFCKNMRDKKKKKRKIESLSFKVDDKKSIQAIQVKVPESGGFWDWVNPFN